MPKKRSVTCNTAGRERMVFDFGKIAKPNAIKVEDTAGVKKNVKL